MSFDEEHLDRHYECRSAYEMERRDNETTKAFTEKLKAVIKQCMPNYIREYLIKPDGTDTHWCYAAHGAVWYDNDGDRPTFDEALECLIDGVLNSRIKTTPKTSGELENARLKVKIAALELEIEELKLQTVSS